MIIIEYFDLEGDLCMKECQSRAIAIAMVKKLQLAGCHIIGWHFSSNIEQGYSIQELELN